ncbi:MAG: DUF3592 domain-containing protein [Pseudomonadota bacterium]
MSNTSSYRSFLGPLGWIILLPSVLTAVGAVWLILTGASLVGDMRSAEGRVVAHQDAFLSQGRTTGKHSVVEFATHDGRSLRVVDSLLRRGGAVHKIGETVTVRYPAGDPLQAQISGSAWIKTLMGVGLLFFSTIGLAVGGLLLRLRPKAAPPVAGR